VIRGAGRKTFSKSDSDGGPAVGTLLNGPRGVAVDSEGNLFIADSLEFPATRDSTPS